MSRRIARSKLLFLWLLLPLLCDQGLKNYLAQETIIAELENTLSFFSWVCNKGVAFGVEFNGFLIVVLNFFIISLLLWVAWNRKLDRGKTIAVFLIIGAAVSNLLDRLVYGCVIDYVDLGFWPVFNLSDAIITISIAYILLKRSPKGG